MNRWKHYLCKFVIFYSVYMGATVLRIDLKKRQLKKPNRWLKIYAFLNNISFLSWIPTAIHLNVTHKQLYDENPVAKYANFITVTLRFAILFIFVFTRGKRDRQLETWLNTLLDIQTSYFDRFRNIPKDRPHLKWLYLNTALTCLHVSLTAADINKAMIEGHMQEAMDLYPLLGMLSIQHLFMLQHALLLCHLRECLSVLNNQLKLNYMDPKLSLIFSQLRSLLQELNGIYGALIFCIQLCLIVTNSMVGYIGLLILLFREQKFTSYGYLFGNAFYLCLLVHMCSYFRICDWVERTMRETHLILFECTSTTTNVENNQEIEKIALSRSLHSSVITICGMFNINLKSLFSIIAQTLLYMVILMQVDYAKIRK